MGVQTYSFVGVDLRDEEPEEKAQALQRAPLIQLSRSGVLANVRANPDYRIVPVEFASDHLLQDFVEIRQGLTTPADLPRFGRCFWELCAGTKGWIPFHEPGDGAAEGGREQFLFWEDGEGVLEAFSQERGSVRRYARALGLGQVRRPSFAGNAICCPLPRSQVSRQWNCIDAETVDRPASTLGVRIINPIPPGRAVNRRIACRTAVNTWQVPFDVDRWRRVAEEAGPLPEP